MSTQQKYSSRERMLIALENKPSDYIPCVMGIGIARDMRSQFEHIERQLELGLDAGVALPELPFRFHPDVKVEEWKEKSGSEYLLHKEYHTPTGKLTAIVRKTRDWYSHCGDSVPLFDDWLTARSYKFLIEKREDLEPFRYLLAEPTADNISTFREQARKYRRFAANKGLLVQGGWNGYDPNKGIDRDGGVMGADALLWLCGAERALLLAMDEPETIKELLQMISQWNMKRMEVYLDEGIDLLRKRAWYESADFWSPSLYGKLIFPILKKEVELTHQAGVKFAYEMPTGLMPLLDCLLESGIDTIMVIDPIPVAGKEVNLKLLKEKIGRKICLWGGVNGHFTIARGTEREVEEAVEKSMSILGPEGFILAPLGGDDSERCWNNEKIMIKTWKRKLLEIRN